MQTQLININRLKNNNGQIEGLPKNPRLLKDDKFKKLVKSIQDDPEMLELREVIAYDNNGELVVIAGNMRLKACQEIGIKEIPTKILPKETSVEKLKAYTIKDNVAFGEHDWNELANSWDVEQLTDWGLDIPNFDVNNLEAQEDDFAVPDGGTETDIVLGDLFEIGEHRLLCGDSTDSDQVAKLMNGQKADITFSSPPYNVGKTPNGNEQKYLNDNDNKTSNEYVELLDNYSKNALLFSDYLFSNIQSLSGNKIALIEHLYNLRSIYADVMIWDKQTAEPAMARKVLNSRFEYVYIFSNEAKRTIGKRDFRGTIDNIFSLNSRQGKEYAKIHKATFPIQLPSLFIENFTESSVIDLFCGTGTTMVASHQLKRKCYGMELDPKYCQVIVDRMKKLDPSLIIKKNGLPL
jgi:DNA modification methylase